MNARDRIAVVGIRDDGPASLDPAARVMVQEAELLCGGRRHLALFPEHPAERFVISADLDALVDRLSHEIGRRRAVVLASGDPCFYGIGPILAERLGRNRVEIMPNVGAVALAFARLGEAWHDATVVSAHGRPLDRAVRQALGAQKLAVLTDAVNTPAAVARALLEAGAEDAPAWVFEHLGGPAERIHPGTLGEIAQRSFADLNLLVALRREVPPRYRDFGRPEADFRHRGGLITKAEIRAVSLSKLRIRPDGILWDVGAGCGSLSIEAAELMPRGTVYAAERSREQIELLRENLAALRPAGHVEIVEGEAPDSLASLPPPDAVFVGGSGGALAGILDLAHDRLISGGRVVVNVATLEHLAECAAWCRTAGIEPEIVQVSIARGTDIAGLTRLAAQNPVFVVTIERLP
jgi:precorrin-6Y C5,15-methyltransferase (decarboxylating)